MQNKDEVLHLFDPHTDPILLAICNYDLGKREQSARVPIDSGLHAMLMAGDHPDMLCDECKAGYASAILQPFDSGGNEVSHIQTKEEAQATLDALVAQHKAAGAEVVLNTLDDRRDITVTKKGGQR
jgi:hypothetical protein